MPVPKKGVAYVFDLCLVSQASRPQFQANPTLAAGDVKVSTDEGAFANITTLPTVSPAAGRNVKVSLSATEMNGDRVVVQFVDAAGSEWDECVVSIDTTAVTVDDLVRSTTPANSLTVEADGMAHADCKEWLGGTIATPTVTGVPEVDVTHWIGTAAATPTVAGVPEVDLTHIAGAAVSTSTAQLGVNVVNAAGTAVQAAGGRFQVDVELWNGTAVPAEHTAGYPIVTIKDGTGTGEIDTASGVVQAQLADGVTHGGTTAALRLGSAGSPALYVTNSAGAAVQFEATSGNNYGLLVQGFGTRPAARLIGGATGHGLHLDGGATSGNAVYCSTSSGHGIELSVSGAAKSGIYAVTSDGHGIDVIAQGTSRHGIQVQGGTAGTSDGVKIIAGTGGVGLRGDTVTFGGTVTFSAFTVTNALTAGSNAVPWNAAWDAEVQSEGEDALVALGFTATVSGRIDATISSRASQTSLDTLDDYVDTEVAAIKAKTDQLTFSTVNRVDTQVFGMEAGTVTAAAVATDAIDADAIADNAINAAAIATGAITSAKFAAGAIDAAALAADAANEIADALLDRADGIEVGLTLRQFCRLVGATTGGKLSGAGTGTEVFRNAVADSANRVTATVDASGNRSAITYSL